MIPDHHETRFLIEMSGKIPCCAASETRRKKRRLLLVLLEEGVEGRVPGEDEHCIAQIVFSRTWELQVLVAACLALP